MRLPNILFPVFMFPFIFHRRSFSPCWQLAILIFLTPLCISMFFSIRNSSRLFSITRSSSFPVIHVSVNIKNNAEKGRPCDFLPNKTLSCIWVAIPVDWLILHWYACGADGRSLARSVYGHVITKFSRMDRLPRFLGGAFAPRLELRYQQIYRDPQMTRLQPSHTNLVIFNKFELRPLGHVKVEILNPKNEQCLLTK